MATPAFVETVRIELGTSEDLDAVMEVMNRAFGDRFGEAWTRSQLAGILPMGGVVLSIASDSKSEKAIGFSLLRSVADEAELLLLAVLPDRHRQGIGGRLLDHFIREAELGGVTRIHLEVRDGNPAVEMYRNAGFEPVGRRRNYYQAADGARYDAITFAKNL
jgi:[ribosomal protein S18]-alanine N-acetyltransferase